MQPVQQQVHNSASPSATRTDTQRSETQRVQLLRPRLRVKRRPGQALAEGSRRIGSLQVHEVLGSISKNRRAARAPSGALRGPLKANLKSFSRKRFQNFISNELKRNKLNPKAGLRVGRVLILLAQVLVHDVGSIAAAVGAIPEIGNFLSAVQSNLVSKLTIGLWASIEARRS